MGANTNIEWATHTFNPWIGCTKISPACDHCYAEAWDRRFAVSGHAMHWGAGVERRRTSEENWKLPLKWNAEAEKTGVRPRVFCASLADVFDNEVPSQWRIDLMKLIRATPHLDWLLLTKRIGNANDMIGLAIDKLPLDDQCGMGQWNHHPVAQWPWPNVWIGATICNQAEADRDIPKLLAVPAAKRFLSIEPLLGPVELGMTNGLVHGHDAADYKLDWVIVGGESGPNARPMHPDWARSLRDQCQAAGVPFLFKQWGEWISADQDECPTGPPFSRWMWGDGAPFLPSDGQRSEALYCRAGKKLAGRILDGRTWDEVPA